MPELEIGLEDGGKFKFDPFFLQFNGGSLLVQTPWAVGQV